jgi:hypothetical protein
LAIRGAEALLGTLVEAADRERIGTYQSALGSIGTARAGLNSQGHCWRRRSRPPPPR